MLGVVTLYNPDPSEAAKKIECYVPYLDKLIVWDNSPLDCHLQQQLKHLLGNNWEMILWQGTGENRCIAQAINFAWKYAREQQFDLLLIMDQDSLWDNFVAYRQEIEEHFIAGEVWAYTPYVIGNDLWSIENTVQKRRLFINSGTVLPIKILDAIDGADETFPLDALDYDLALRIVQRGYTSFCLTQHKLYHTIGQPKRSSFLKLYTPNYGATRTYSIIRSHLISYRKNKAIMTRQEKWKVFKEFLYWKFVRILLAEPDKANRFMMYFKGIKDGLTFDLSQTKR